MSSISISPYIQERYIAVYGTRLERFRRKNDRLWNFRCVECGDSKKDSTKCRGFIHWYDRENTYFYSCRKCGFALEFTNWLRSKDESLFKEMLIDALKDNGVYRERKEKKVEETIVKMDEPDFSKVSSNINNNPTVENNDSSSMFEMMKESANVNESLSTDSKGKNDNSVTKIVEYSDIMSDNVHLLEGFKKNIFHGQRSVADLPDDHGAKKYVMNRKIPEEYYSKMFFVWRFFEWINTWKPNKFSKGAMAYDEPRLVIPFYNEQGEVFAVQGRSFKKGDDVIRYITIKKNDDDPKIYGLETLDKEREAYILEGPIDSMFVDNALAMAGADVSFLDTFTKNYVMVYDNEPRSKDIVSRLHQDINNGKKVVIWPTNIGFKDVNDMIMKGGYTVEEIRSIINSHTYKGMTAKLKLTEWSKINLNQNKKYFGRKN